MFAFISFLSLSLPLLSAAQVVPNAPGPNEVFKQGSPCLISWTADATGKWQNTFIELMTGPNQPMTHLTTVANVDGTDPTKTSISIPCPAVTPNAPIYFYQFTAQDQNATWTGRFAISDLNGATSPPPNANQPDGSATPWGAGKILSSPGSPPPPTAPSGQVDGSGSGSSSGFAAVASSSSAPVLTASVPSSSSAASFASQPLTTPSPSPASTSEITSVRVPATTSTLSLSPAPVTANTSTTHASSAINNPFPAAPAIVVAAILGLVPLY